MRKKSGEVLLTEYLESVLKGLREVYAAALGGEPEAIHQARVATRRLWAALSVLAPTLLEDDARRLGKPLRKLRKKLGPLRDLDVMMDALGEVGADGKHSKAVEWAKYWFNVKRKAVASKTLGKGQKGLRKLDGWTPVFQRLQASGGDGSRILSDCAGEQLVEFARRADFVAQRHSEEERAAVEEDLGDPHVLRIAGKKLRYTLEMAEACNKRGVSKTVRIFKRMQGALGEWHDYALLSQRLMELAAERMLPAHHGEIQRELLKLEGVLLRKSEGRLARLGKLWNTHGELIRQTVAQLSLRNAGVEETRTGTLSIPEPGNDEGGNVDQGPGPTLAI